MTVETSALSTIARVLEPPTLKYRSPSGGQEHIEHPINGHWKMSGKHFYKPAKIESWALVSYVPSRIFSMDMKEHMTEQLVKAWQNAGIEVVRPKPIGTPEYLEQHELLDRVQGVKECSLFVIVVPDANNKNVYLSVKHWGDVKRGIPTQCIRLRNCSNDTPEFWANITHKINLKLGGINVVADHTGLTVPGSTPLLGDVKNVTVVLGADVSHPSTGGSVQPSYAGVVCSVDTHASKYVAGSRLQQHGVEMIGDLHQITGALLSAHMRYRREKEVAPEHEVPKRLIFFRDGVSENQFQTVIDNELPQIKWACDSLNIKPKISLIIVSKRHHMRFFQEQKNCQSGTVIDRDVVHPTDFDFYLQSHGQFGERGTTRSAHYSVLYDENNLTPDQVQALAFALCHVYSRSPTAVSIPAPVYYAHRVCDRMRIHFDPKAAKPMPSMSDRGSPPPEEDSFEAFLRSFKSIHANHKDVMYFV